MNKAQGSISFLQVCFLFILMQGLSLHVLINPIIMDASGRDAWISVIFTMFPFLLWCIILVLFMRRSNQQKLQPWLAEKTNTFVSWVIMAPIIIQLYLIAGMTLFHTSTWTVTNYLPNAPKFVLSFFLILLCCYCAIQGLKAVAIAAGALFPIVVILGYFVSLANTPNKNYNLLLPIMEHGIQPALNGMIYLGGGFSELIMLIAIQHRIKSKIKIWHMVLLGVLLTYVTIGTIIGGITEFGPYEAAKQFESPYEQWRLVKLGQYIEHVDFLSVFQWLAGAIVRVSFSIYLISECFNFKSFRKRNWFIVLISTSYLLIPFLQMNQEIFYHLTYQIYFPASLIVASVITILWVSIAYLPKRKKETAT